VGLLEVTRQKRRVKATERPRKVHRQQAMAVDRAPMLPVAVVLVEKASQAGAVTVVPPEAVKVGKVVVPAEKAMDAAAATERLSRRVA
jgi:hypothetical protein